MQNIRINMLRQVPILSDLSHDELALLSQFTRRRRLNKKTILYSEGTTKQSLYFIQEGLVKAYKTDENGNRSIIAYYKKGDLFPQVSLFNTPTHATSVSCIVQTVVLVLPITPFKHFLREHPTATLKMVQALGERIDSLQKMLHHLKGEDTQHRGQMFLLKLAENHGDHDGGEIRIGIPMTYQELADTIGTTREQARRFILRLRDGGIVDMQRSGFIIHDVEALRQWQEN